MGPGAMAHVCYSAVYTKHIKWIPLEPVLTDQNSIKYLRYTFKTLALEEHLATCSITSTLCKMHLLIIPDLKSDRNQRKDFRDEGKGKILQSLLCHIQ